MGEAFICRGAGSFWNGNGGSVEFKPTIITTNSIYEAPSTGIYKISCVSGGGGGGGGCINTKDTSVSYYGYPGNKGGLQTKEVTLNEGDKVTVTIGIGGNPGTKNSTRTAITGGWRSTGGAGATGGSSAFGSHLTSIGGTAGVGGSYSNYWTNTPTSWNNQITGWNNSYPPGTMVCYNEWVYPWFHYSVGSSTRYDDCRWWSGGKWTGFSYVNWCKNNNSNIAVKCQTAQEYATAIKGKIGTTRLVIVEDASVWNQGYSTTWNMRGWTTPSLRDIYNALLSIADYRVSYNNFYTNTWLTNSTINKYGCINKLDYFTSWTAWQTPTTNTPRWTNTPTAWDNKETIQDSCYHTAQQGQAWYLSGNDVTDQGSASTIRTYSGDGGASGAAGNSGFILIIPPQA